MWLFLTLIVGWLLRDLTIPGLPLVHDSNPHISRAIAYHTALMDGQWPPMWAKDVLGGIGSPVLMLNYQLPYLLGELWHRLGLSFFDSYKLSLGFSLVVSAILMYLALRQLGSRASAWIGTILYTLAPYRMVDIFVRGALGESLSFMFPPLILWGFAKHSQVLLTLGWAGLFLTHPVAAACFSAFFLGYAWIKKIPWREWVIPYVVALLLAAFNLVPTLAYTKLTYYSPALSDTLLMFPTLAQLIHSPWGYGVSLPGSNDGMSFAIGLLGWSALLIGSLVLWKRKEVLVRYTTILVWICIGLMLPLSTPIYNLGLAQIIDFPWRLLMCVVFGTSMLAALISSRLTKRRQLLLALLVTVVGIYLTYPLAKTNDYWPVSKDLDFFARETGDSYGEYAPLTRSTRDSAPFGKRAEFTEGTGEITTLVEHSNWQKYKVEANTPGVVRINTAYFVGWQMPPNCVVTKRTLTHIDDSGLISCPVTTGVSELEIKFLTPPMQKLGNLLTLAGLGGFIWILLASFYPRLMKKTR